MTIRFANPEYHFITTLVPYVCPLHLRHIITKTVTYRCIYTRTAKPSRILQKPEKSGETRRPEDLSRLPDAMQLHSTVLSYAFPNDICTPDVVSARALNGMERNGTLRLPDVVTSECNEDVDVKCTLSHWYLSSVE